VVSGGTFSEQLFEEFCARNEIPCARIPKGATKTPDYRIDLNGNAVVVEIKQIDQIEGFNPYGVHTSTPGELLRQKIAESRKQIQYAAKQKEPAILLVYNSVDPFQLLGTDEIDFKTAMYGEMTVVFRAGAIADGPFNGRNARLQKELNTSFSAIGVIRQRASGPVVEIYENVHAKHPLPFEALPKCMGMRRVELA
jgi:hypothetical protein